MKTTLVAILCVIAWFGILATFVNYLATEKDKRYAEFFQAMKEHNCKRTGFVGRDASPVWTCPDGTAYKEGQL